MWSYLLLFTLMLSGGVHAHGYISTPPSRSYNCKLGKATSCGDIQWEPQSVEAPKGLPFNRKASSKGTLCSAEISRFAQLDRVGTWPTANAAAAFTWTFTALHATTNFQYFITKPDWDTSKALDASSLETTPILTVEMNGKPPASTETHSVDKMPSRTGYHIVYAVWTINDTSNAFYQCVDLDFGTSAKSIANSSDTASTTDDTTSNTTSAIDDTMPTDIDTDEASTDEDLSTSNDDSTSTDEESGTASTTSDTDSSTNKTISAKVARCQKKKRRSSRHARARLA